MKSTIDILTDLYQHLCYHSHLFQSCIRNPKVGHMQLLHVRFQIFEHELKTAASHSLCGQEIGDLCAEILA